MGEVKRYRQGLYGLADDIGMGAPLDASYVSSTDYDALRAENAELVAALEEIASPVKFMREQLEDGEQLNGLMAMEITSSPDFYKKIARSALAKHRGE